MGCRSRLVTKMRVHEKAGQVNLPVLDSDLALIVHNPSLAVVLLRWGAGPVDPSDQIAGYDVVLPHLSYSTVPVPAGVSIVAIDWVYAGVAGSAQPVPVDVSGRDCITVWATPANVGAESSALDMAGGWVNAQRQVIGVLTDGTSDNGTDDAPWQALNIFTLATPALIVSVDAISHGTGGPIAGAVWRMAGDTPTTVLGAGGPVALVGGWYQSPMGGLVVPAGTWALGMLFAPHARSNLKMGLGESDYRWSCRVPGAASPVAYDSGIGTSGNYSGWPIRAQILAAV